MKKNFNFLMVFAIAASMLASCSKSEGESSAKAEKEDLPLVEVETANNETVDQLSEYTATVEAYKTNNIMSNSGCRIKRLLVDVGSHVAAGQTLVILDDVNIATQSAAIDQQRIQLANAKRDLERAKQLVTIGGGTQQTVDQLQASYDAQVRAIESSRRSLSTMSENTVLTSPISGVVTQRNFQAGDLPSGQPILVIEQQNPLKVVVAVNESEMANVKQGMPVGVSFDTYPGESFSGHVSLIHPTVDVNTRTFQVEVTIENRGDKVHSGMFARVQFNFGRNTSIVVSDRAVQKQIGSGVRYVYTLEDNGTVKFREVETGRHMGNRYEIKGGLTPGMRVVTKGHTRLTNGCKVDIAKK
ncbi:MAG: efflux RND transporter periplasmic adaptor subunit [Bacteroidales bacterium]|nr:efflux RND transporter periplasmic adaptor subunit [Bacteroidales bacterium]